MVEHHATDGPVKSAGKLVLCGSRVLLKIKKNEKIVL
jgi:hypothetical protein